MIKPIETVILVEPIAPPTEAGGIHLPNATNTIKGAQSGVVIAIGDKVKSDQLKQGATVYFNRLGAQSVYIDQKQYLFVAQGEVLGIG